MNTTSIVCAFILSSSLCSLSVASMVPMSLTEAKAVQGMGCGDPQNPDPYAFGCEHATTYKSGCNSKQDVDTTPICNLVKIVCGNTGKVKVVTDGPTNDGACVNPTSQNCCELINIECVRYDVHDCKTKKFPTLCSDEDNHAAIDYIYFCSDATVKSYVPEGKRKYAVACL